MATNHITNDLRNVHDRVAISPGKERLMIDNGKEMRLTGVGSFNLKVHTNNNYNVNFTERYARRPKVGKLLP